MTFKTGIVIAAILAGPSWCTAHAAGNSKSIRIPAKRSRTRSEMMRDGATFAGEENPQTVRSVDITRDTKTKARGESVSHAASPRL